jgi:hypothetical protein
MPSSNLYRGKNVRGYATPVSAPIYVDSDDNKAKFIPAGSGTTEVELVDASSAQTLTNKTLTAPVITGSLGVDTVETVAATNAITAAESGSIFFLNHATEFDSTIPAPFAGGRYTFVVSGAPSGANYTITSAGANQILGQVYTTDVNSATDPDFEASGANTISFVSAKAIAGDKVELISDGTTWFAYAFCSVFDAITFTDV